MFVIAADHREEARESEITPASLQKERQLRLVSQFPNILFRKTACGLLLSDSCACLVLMGYRSIDMTARPLHLADEKVNR